MNKGLVEVGNPAPAGPEAWWQTNQFWWVLAFLSTTPFWFTTLPPLGDLFTHMGRYHVLLNHSSSTALNEYYRVEWVLIPNLGQDLLMLLFGPVFGVELGAILLTAAVPFFMVLMIGKLSRAMHGNVQPLAFLALPFAYPMTFSFGFVNFHTGVVVALAAVLFWFQSIKKRSLVSSGVLAVLAALAWLCHASAWGILVIGIAALELAEVRHAADRRYVRALAQAVLNTLPLTLPVLLFAFGPERQANSGAAKYDLFDLDVYLQWYSLKFSWLLYTLRDQLKLLDYASTVLIFAVPASLFLFRRLTLHIGLVIWSLALFALYWILPQNFLGGYYADFRLLFMVGITALLAGRCVVAKRTATLIALGGMCLFGARLAQTSVGWAATGDRLENDLRALAYVPRQARIAAAAPDAYCGSWKMEAYSHLASLAVVRRDAFVSLHWDLPGQQVMQPIHLPGSRYNTIQSLDVTAPGSDCGTISVNDYLAGLPRNEFDFVWLFKSERSADNVPWLKLVYRGPSGSLYAVRDSNRGVLSERLDRPAAEQR